jgi:CRP-like cAMP-binding protein
MYSFITQQPGNINIDAIEESDILILSKEKREDLLINIPKFERYFRIIIEKSLVANRQRIIERLSLTAKERYNNFCNTYPTLINQIPQKQIASYIGITPEFLSKIRTLKKS